MALEPGSIATRGGEETNIAAIARELAMVVYALNLTFT